MTGFDCVSVDGLCGCRLPCSEQSPLACQLGYCAETGKGEEKKKKVFFECNYIVLFENKGCVSQNGTCVCGAGIDSSLELLAIIGVPTFFTFLLVVLFLTTTTIQNGMKHKYQ